MELLQHIEGKWLLSVCVLKFCTNIFFFFQDANNIKSNVQSLFMVSSTHDVTSGVFAMATQSLSHGLWLETTSDQMWSWFRSFGDQIQVHVAVLNSVLLMWLGQWVCSGHNFGILKSHNLLDIFFFDCMTRKYVQLTKVTDFTNMCWTSKQVLDAHHFSWIYGCKIPVT